MRLAVWVLLVVFAILMAFTVVLMFPAHGQIGTMGAPQHGDIPTLLPFTGTISSDRIANACPPDRPHRVEIEVGLTCHPVGCLGRLRCDDKSALAKCWHDTSVCAPACTPRVERFCLSDEDLEAARK